MIYLYNLLSISYVRSIGKVKGLFHQYLGWNTLVVLGFGVFALLGILRHELWEDELQAWMLARDSNSILHLFQNMRYEGHPALWHVLLLGLTKLGHNPLLMQLLSWLIGVGSACCINYFSPLPRIQKLTLTFSYFLFYEYTIVSRSYGLGICLAFIFCALSDWRKNRHPMLSLADWSRLWLRLILLVMLANTSVYGLILSFVLSIYLLFERWELDVRSVKLALSSIFSRIWRFKVYVFFLVSGWLFAAYQIGRALLQPESQIISQVSTSVLHSPWGQESFRSATQFSQASINFDLGQITKISHLLAYVWKSYVPIPQLEDPSFWNTSFLSDTPAFWGTVIPGLGGVNLGQFLSVALSGGLLWITSRYFITNSLVKGIYITGNALLIGFFFLFLPTGIRHHGHLFVLLIICLWLDKVSDFKCVQRSTQNDQRLSSQPLLSRGLSQRLLNLILVIQSLVGFYAYSIDWQYRFSGSRDAVRFLKSLQLEDLPIIGTGSWETSVFSGYLNRDIYYPDLGRWGSFITPSIASNQEDDILNEIRRTVLVEGKALVILDRAMLLKQLEVQRSPTLFDSISSEFNVDFLRQVDGEIVTKESYSIYLIQPDI